MSELLVDRSDGSIKMKLRIAWVDVRQDFLALARGISQIVPSCQCDRNTARQKTARPATCDEEGTTQAIETRKRGPKRDAGKVRPSSGGKSDPDCNGQARKEGHRPNKRRRYDPATRYLGKARFR
jgi:hypothetical protein